MKLSAKLILFLTIIMIFTLSPILLIIWNHQRNIIFEQAKIQAKTLFDMIIITRQWVAENRDRIEPVPAVATKELSKYANKMTNFRFHITSDILVNPENAPDDFEKGAIKLFRNGVKEYEDVTYDKKVGKVYRYMAPLFINESCLTCHDYQGYKVGDFRGGISIFIPLKEIEQSIKANNRLFYTTAFIMFTSLLIGIIVLLHTLILKYLKRLSLSAKGIINNKSIAIPVFNTGDEIQELSEAFNKMYNQIIKNEENLKIKLKEAISEYIKIHDELVIKNQELLKSNKFKSDVIDSLAHEIRTPLTKIISYSDILLRTKNDEEVEETAKKVIVRNAGYLNRLFNHFLILTKLEYATFEFKKENILLRNMVIKWINFYNDEISKKNIRVKIDIPEDLFIVVDEDFFDHVLNNLISNAIKYNIDFGKIEISAKCEGDKTIISVYDTGVGIKDDEKDKIFQRFYRSENVKKRISGTGLGLSIAYRVVEKMGGKLKVESIFGKYTVFTITLYNK
ncbi:DUF3365 domain-containing protein [Deferribacterales bacterium Es71-Z0220]|uniref:ATP-binding protein n=1 Tax=Deferrivibrio essentukiensis TaxID=2880922 RepID=UPI001F622A7D|nr:ATP-binding protein [Deferrivibrio essentukiensis]MCB4203916.1 DUF3365 domain-containing protein [Deferrivibrio essentukiensis]